jgi:hypothetical protein
MQIELYRSEIDEINKRASESELYSNLEKLLYQASVELERIGCHNKLTEASCDLSNARREIAEYYTKHSVACEDYLFHYSTIDTPEEGDYILAFDAICIHFGQVNGYTTLFGGCWSVLGEDNKDRFLVKKYSRKIIGIEQIDFSSKYPKIEIISMLSREMFLNSLMEKFNPKQ